MLNITLTPRQGKKMNRDEIRDSVLKVLGRVFSSGGKELNLTESTTLAELNVNSTQMINIVLDLEDEFGVNIGDSDAPNLYTVGEIVTVIDSLLNASNKSAY